MSTVRRIIVEANVIVIILKTGRTVRIPMASVARMAIEPQIEMPARYSLILSKDDNFQPARVRTKW